MVSLAGPHARAHRPDAGGGVRGLRGGGGPLNDVLAHARAALAAREDARPHALALGLIRGGWELHARGRGAGVAPDDPDLALLLGDRLYAAGLLELVNLGDLEAVRTMAEVISSCAQALAEDEADRATTAWEAAERLHGYAATG